MYRTPLMTIGLCLAIGSAYATNLNPGGSVSPVPIYSYGSPAFPSGLPNTGPGHLGANPLLQEGASWAPAGSGTPAANITFENVVYANPGLAHSIQFPYWYQKSVKNRPPRTPGHRQY